MSYSPLPGVSLTVIPPPTDPDLGLYQPPRFTVAVEDADGSGWGVVVDDVVSTALAVFEGHLVQVQLATPGGAAAAISAWGPDPSPDAMQAYMIANRLLPPPFVVQ